MPQYLCLFSTVETQRPTKRANHMLTAMMPPIAMAIRLPSGMSGSITYILDLSAVLGSRRMAQRGAVELRGWGQ